MKLSTLAVTAILTLATSSVFAKDVVLKAVDTNFETKVCFTAASEGLSAAKSLVRQNDLSYGAFARAVSCNGLSIAQFAKQYGEETEITEVKGTRFALVAKNRTTESQLCLDAVVIGEEAARDKHDIYGEIICNRQDLSDFVESFENKEVEVRITED